MQKFTDVPEVPVTQLYKHMIGQNETVLPFELKNNKDEEPSIIWKLLKHAGTYVKTIGLILAAYIGVYCFKNSGSDLPHSLVSQWHAIVDDNVEAAPI